MSDASDRRSPEATSRRTALKRALLGGLGLAGIASGAQARQPTPGGSGALAPPRERTLVLELEIADLDRYARHRAAGEQLDRGERETVSAALLDVASRRPAGRLSGVAFALTGPGTPAPAASRLELHTLSLGEGTIVISGTTGPTGGTLVVSGGTGAYAGARGSAELTEEDGEGAARLTVALTLASDRQPRQGHPPR